MWRKGWCVCSLFWLRTVFFLEQVPRASFDPGSSFALLRSQIWSSAASLTSTVSGTSSFLFDPTALLLIPPAWWLTGWSPWQQAACIRTILIQVPHPPQLKRGSWCGWVQNSSSSLLAVKTWAQCNLCSAFSFSMFSFHCLSMHTKCEHDLSRGARAGWENFWAQWWSTCLGYVRSQVQFQAPQK